MQLKEQSHEKSLKGVVLKDEKDFDGITKYEPDSNVEASLAQHFLEYDISGLEVANNFQMYSRRTILKKFLSHYELFCKTINLPGDIVEIGVYRGASLMSWANFLEIRNMGDRQKQVFGFDNFSGFTKLDEKDGKHDSNMHKEIGGFNGGVFEEALKDCISIFDKDRFIPYKPRVRLIKGNAEKTIPEFVKETPGLRISLLHFDVDLYTPTKTGLEYLWDLVVKGGIVLFDEYGLRPWEGESKAVDEFFEKKNVELKRFDWCANPGAYIIKG